MSLLYILFTLFLFLLLNFNLKHSINSQTTSSTSFPSTTSTSTSTITSTTSTQNVAFFTNIFTLPVPSGVLPLGSTALIYCQYNTSDLNAGWNITINGTLVNINSDPRYSILFYIDEQLP